MDKLIGKFVKIKGSSHIGYITATSVYGRFTVKLIMYQKGTPYIATVRLNFSELELLESELQLEDLYTLIDLSLVTKDKEWFMELSNKKNALVLR